MAPLVNRFINNVDLCYQVCSYCKKVKCWMDDNIMMGPMGFHWGLQSAVFCRRLEEVLSKTTVCCLLVS